MNSDGLIVIGRLSYPSGSAPSNRVHLYCKALKEAKGFPFVINLHSTFTKPQPFNYLGRYEGVPFYYSQKTPMRENKFIQRYLNFPTFFGSSKITSLAVSNIPKKAANK